jgi:hypothetical protein
MNTTFEQAIEIVRRLPLPEREKVREWIEEENQKLCATENKQKRLESENENFCRALQWIEEHKEEFDGQFVVLDGDKLIAHGTDSKTVYDEARAKGYNSPFLKRVKANVLPFGGW